MIYVINYADGEPYESFRKINTRTAYRFGKADKVIEYSTSDVSEEFRAKNANIFAYKRGAGLWLWKPYLIHKALSQLEEGDWLFYSDAGVTFINNLHHLTQCASNNNLDIFTVEQPTLCRQFTKRECYIELGIDDHDENQALGLILLRKSNKSMRFIQEWLDLCQREELISPKYFRLDVKEWSDFVAHREDQSLLSLLRDKWGLPAFRDPSDYGEMPFMYATTQWTYNPKKYSNSPYPTIILCNRKVSPYRYYAKYLVKRLLGKLGIYYTEKQILKKRNVKI